MSNFNSEFGDRHCALRHRALESESEKVSRRGDLSSISQEKRQGHPPEKTAKSQITIEVA